MTHSLNKVRYIKTYLLVVSIDIFILAMFFLLLKAIRGIYPLNEIGPQKIVGYSQYFGYPYLFDSLYIFTIIITIALIPYLLSRFISTRNGK